MPLFSLSGSRRVILPIQRKTGENLIKSLKENILEAYNILSKIPHTNLANCHTHKNAIVSPVMILEFGTILDRFNLLEKLKVVQEIVDEVFLLKILVY